VASVEQLARPIDGNDLEILDAKSTGVDVQTVIEEADGHVIRLSKRPRRILTLPAHGVTH
jgi:hypothetical protein